ncbi:uncharacterized protein [Heptranchias perlo]|uniref:uncharacterized protein n=1 Tax=Heptranchias perlo TaxID=212740 RepID=UPI003559A263
MQRDFVSAVVNHTRGHNPVYKSPSHPLCTLLLQSCQFNQGVNREIMASSGELAQFGKDFFVDLLPEAEKVALHFELSHLYLAKNSDLEKEIRSRASTSRLLFNSSSNLLLRCAVTSENIVSSLFPILRLAAENNDIGLAQSTFTETREWIKGIHTAAVDLRDRFSSFHQKVNSDCSLVLSTRNKNQNETKMKQEEMKAQQEHMNSLNEKKKQINADIDLIKKKINIEEVKKQKLMDEIRRKDELFAIGSAVIPLFGWIACAVNTFIVSPVDVKNLNQLDVEIGRLWSQKKDLEKQKENLEYNIFTEQMKLISTQLEEGFIISETENLKYVESHLCKAQEVLEVIINFWEQAAMVINGLEQKTKVPEMFLQNLKKYQEQFLKSLEIAEKMWQLFSSYCLESKNKYDAGTKDLYKFLAISPSSLSQEELKKRITAANLKLKDRCLSSSTGAAPSVAASPVNV